MYRSLPGGLHDAGPNPQPTLPQRLHFCSSSSSLLRTYFFWPRLRCTELGRILLSFFSPGDSLNQSPGARYSVARPPPFGGPWLCVHPPHDGVALLAALLRKMRLLDLLSASRESHANIISESLCLGAGLPLFTELPRETVWKVLSGCSGGLRSALWRAKDTLRICPTMNGVASVRICLVPQGKDAQASRLTGDPRRRLLRPQERLPLAAFAPRVPALEDRL